MRNIERRKLSDEIRNTKTLILTSKSPVLVELLKCKLVALRTEAREEDAKDYQRLILATSRRTEI